MTVKFEVDLKNSLNKTLLIDANSAQGKQTTTGINSDTMATVESMIEKLVDGPYMLATSATTCPKTKVM